MKRFLLYFLLVCCLQETRAQDGDKLGTLKVAYLSRKMNLTPEEAQRFWPIYNQYSDELLLARVKSQREGRSELDLEETILNIRKKYNTEFLKVLPPYKVDSFYKAEKDFSNFIKREIERRQLRQQQKRSLNP